MHAVKIAEIVTTNFEILDRKAAEKGLGFDHGIGRPGPSGSRQAGARDETASADRMVGTSPDDPKT